MRLTTRGRVVLGVAVVLLCLTGVQAWQGFEEADPVPVRAGEERSTAPTRLRIPTMDVDASVEPLGLQEDGTLEVPDSSDEAGWWSGGSLPGRPGPTVLVAHRDSATGPALFYELPYLQAGDPVFVTDSSGRSHEYVVDSVRQYPRTDFPTRAVYGETSRPTLRLLTCAGAFDRRSGYEDNVVVFATAV